LPGRPSTLAQRLLRPSRAVRPGGSLAGGETLPMRKPPTGEPYAGKPHVRFGGRGGSKALPDPYHELGMRRVRKGSFLRLSPAGWLGNSWMPGPSPGMTAERVSTRPDACPNASFVGPGDLLASAPGRNGRVRPARRTRNAGFERRITTGPE